MRKALILLAMSIIPGAAFADEQPVLHMGTTAAETPAMMAAP